MIKQAIEIEKSADSTKIAEGLSKIENFNGVTGDITINKNHDPEKPIAIEQLTNGKVSKTYEIK
ncbi:branched-chain amino acid ABC transporter, amino acid-binding protein [Lentilactobacillus kosonis]|uniref:Branched-chain amino acid ABC transporter, amino acid-binding protein n=1 Tax=Lentilactobacillus kosonis TaxID=2810561 RepID=A0A401FM31_9LACO|nr:branched-chain amino acid ABC transporter, amino acid-binding protein [Lentilactobacillus kosonis]